MIGCHVYIHPPGEHASTLEPHINVVFLSRLYHQSDTGALSVYSYNKINKYAHVSFYKGIHCLDDPPPKSCQLHVALGHPLPPESSHVMFSVVCILVSLVVPSQVIVTSIIPIHCDDTQLGLVLGCVPSSRLYMRSKFWDWHQKYRAAFLVQVNGRPLISRKAVMQWFLRHVMPCIAPMHHYYCDRCPSFCF
jgi:hypothetical protein